MWSSDFQLTATHFFPLSWFYSLLATFLGRCPLAMACPKSLGLCGNQGFTFTAIHNGLSRHPFRHTSDAYLISAAFISLRGRFHNPFLWSLTLKPCDRTSKFCFLLGLEHVLSVQLYLCQCSIFNGFPHYLSLAVMKLFLYARLALNSRMLGLRMCTTSLNFEVFINYFSHFESSAEWELSQMSPLTLLHWPSGFSLVFLSLRTYDFTLFHFLVCVFLPFTFCVFVCSACLFSV